MTDQRTRVLFLCTGNSCRSQMGEGWARHLYPDTVDAYSAGIEKHGLNLNAVRVMTEVGIDITGHTSKTLDDLKGVEFDLVITVCGHAHETCPVFPADARVVHQGFDDPPKLALDAETEEEALAHCRRVRDEIGAFMQTLPELIRTQPNA